MMKKSRLLPFVVTAVVVSALLLVFSNLPSAPDDLVLPTLAVLPDSSGDTSLPTAAPTDVAALPAQSDTQSSAPDLATSEPQPVQPTVPPLPTSQPAVLEVPAEAVPEQLVLRFAPEASEAERSAYLAELGATVTESIDALDTVVVSVSAEVAAAPLPPAPALAASEPDYFVVALHNVADHSATDDTYFPQQWALTVIGAIRAWQVLPLAPEIVTVAVIDSGICADHPDLAGRILAGYDFVEDDATPQDDYGHGCAASGIIAANIDNAVGIAGLAPNTRVLPLRVLNGAGIGTYSDLAAAIVYAADNGAKVINLSLGGAYPSAVLEEAVNYAAAKGVILVAAAGNSGSEGALYPAAYESVIAVGSIDSSMVRSSFSNYGPAVDIYAPGRDIVTTHRDGTYSSVTGTSFAAPFVAAAAAMEIANGRSLVLGGGILALSTEPVVVSGPTSTPPLGTTATPPQTVVGLFTDTSAQAALDVSQNLGVLRTRYVDINFPVLETSVALGAQANDSNTIVLNLFDGTSLTAVLDRIEPHPVSPNGYIWIGHVLGENYGEVSLTVNEGLIEGSIQLGSRFFQVTYAGNDVHAINQIDYDQINARHVNPIPVDLSTITPEDRPAVSGDVAGSAVGDPVIDILIVYTAAARADLGGTTNSVQNAIVNAVNNVNQAYINSRINQRMRIVHMAEVAYTEVGDNGTGSSVDDDLSRLQAADGVIDNVRTLRETYNADLVHMITSDGTNINYCGIAYYPRGGAGLASYASFGAYPYGITVSSCLTGGRTLAHETGHNLGAAHDIYTDCNAASPYYVGPNSPGNPSCQGVTSYAFGYRNINATAGTNFITIMAYRCGSPDTQTPGQTCATTMYFSNLVVSSPFDPGQNIPMGTASEDMRRTLNETSSYAVAFRGATVPAASAPTLVSPVNGFTGNDTTPTLTWNAVAGATSYELQVDNENTFTDPASYVINTTNTSETTPDLAYNTYYWRVRANQGAWSEIRTLIINNGPPAPVLTAPTNGSTITDTTPTLTWNSVVDAVSYDVQVDTTNTFVAPFSFEQTGIAGTSVTTTGLANGTYYWRARTNSASETGVYGTIYSFTVDTTAPLAPTLTSPANNAQLTVGQVLVWQASATATSYQVDFGPVGALATYNTASTSFNLPVTLNIGASYEWKVRAVDAVGNVSADSETRTFTLVSVAGVAPLRNVTADTTPDLTWNRLTWAVRYEIQVANNAAFTGASTYTVTDGTTLTFTIPSPLTEGTWYWRVRGCTTPSGTCNGAFSLADTFVIDTP